MFAEHNGHELAQLEDVTSIIKQNIHDLNKLLMNTKRIVEDKRSYVVYLKKEIERLKEVQLKNIDQGFAALIKRMEDKRDALKEEFKTKYVNEAMTMYNKINLIDKYNNDISNIEIVYEELFKFINKNIDAKVCAKITDISSFISKSIEDLEKIAKAKGFDKSEAYIKPELKPLTLNVDKAYEIIGKFNLISSKPSKKTQGKEAAPKQVKDSNEGYEDYQPSPAVGHHRKFDSRDRNASSIKKAESRMKNEYDEYEKYSQREPNFSTMGRRGDYENQNQNAQEDYPRYSKNYEAFRQEPQEDEDDDNGENIAQRSMPNAFEGRFSKNSYHGYDDEVEADIRNVEEIQKELHQMDITHKI